MPQNVALSSSAGLVSNFSISSTFQSLPSKVNGVFGVYLTVALGLCIYHVYRGYQCITNPTPKLHDKFTVGKCELLFKEIKNLLDMNENADVTSLVQKCEELHNSMTEKNAGVSLGLVAYYAKKEPEKALRIVASGFSTEKEILDACQMIHRFSPTFNCNELIGLLKIAYEKRKVDLQDPVLEVKKLLRYAELAHSLDNTSELKETALMEAINMTTKCRGGLAQVNVCFEVDKVCKELESAQLICETDKFKSFLRVIKEKSDAALLINDDSLEEPDRPLPKIDRFKAHLTLAKAQLLCREDNQEALGRARNLFDQGLHQEFELLASVYRDSNSATQAQEVISAVVFTAYQAGNDASNVDQATVLLRIADAYLEHNVLDLATPALVYALGAIEKLPESTEDEIYSKYKLVKRVGVCQAMTTDLEQRVLALFDHLYHTSSNKSVQQRLVLSMIEFCNRKRLEEKSKEWFEIYLNKTKTSNEDAIRKISALVIHVPTNFTPEQRAQCFQAAEELLPQVPDYYYKEMLTAIYLHVNPAKGCKLIDSYAERVVAEHKSYTLGQAMKNGLMAVIPLITLPIFRSNPVHGLFCMAVAKIWHISRT